MAVTQSIPRILPFSPPTVLRRMRATCLTRYDPLNRWIGAADMKTSLDLFLTAALPPDEVMCQLFVGVVEVESFGLSKFQGILGTVYTLSLTAYDRRHAGSIQLINLDRYSGSPGDVGAPLWVRRLPPQKFVRFSQPRAFVARLVAGNTEIHVEHMLEGKITTKMLSWARQCAIGTPAHRSIARRCKTVALGDIRVWARGKNLRCL
ncbi:hypothetical protein B0H11DRAFT_1934008 [Mycena galericulata]|nr:hypothetical protein B0H11DRAFT_1933970 [Mycena galericulata]KAJ7440120.1 hypothetical protein B0H11DRAFT_1934008 [Mycena galericulata]